MKNSENYITPKENDNMYDQQTYEKWFSLDPASDEQNTN